MSETRQAAIPWQVNVALAGLLAAANLFLLFLLPVLAADDARWGWVLVPLALTTPTLWSLIHEAIHGVLHSDPRTNDALGRLLAVLFGSPFRLLRLGHLMHHRFNRTDLDRTEVVTDGDAGDFRAHVIYYLRLLGGLYLAEAAASAAVLLPRPLVARAVAAAFGNEGADGRSMRRAADRHLLEPGALRDLRLDGIAICLIYAAAFWMWGPLWGFLALAMLGRAFLISFFDNAYHYGTPLDDVLYSHNLRLPAPLAAAMLNFNLHAVHHRQPALPWTALGPAFRDSEGGYEGGFLAVALRQLRGPLAASRLPRAALKPTRDVPT